MQHPSLSVLENMTAEIEEFVHGVAAKQKLEVAEYSNVWSYDPSEFDAAAVACVEQAAKEMGFSYQKLISHTGKAFFSMTRGPCFPIFTCFRP